MILLLMSFSWVADVYAENAHVEFNIYHGNHDDPYGRKIVPGGNLDSKYLVMNPDYYFGLPALNRKDLTVYALFSGNNTDNDEWGPVYPGFEDGMIGTASAADIIYVPTEEHPYLAISYAISLMWGSGSHVPAYDSISVWDNKGRQIGCGYYFESDPPSPEGDNNVSKGFVSIGSPDGWVLRIGYRNWRTMYYDLSNYIGKPITIKMTASCCTNFNCHSWLYFALEEFGQQIVCSNNCPATLLHAPAGQLSYEWHKGSANGPIVGTDSILEVESKNADRYFCTFTDADCGNRTFLLGTPIQTVSDFTWHADCNGIVSFSNSSYVIYPDHKNKKVLPDTIYWDYGFLGKTSNEYKGSRFYYPEGEYDVTLHVGLKDFVCDSAITKRISVKQHRSSETFLTVCKKDFPFTWNGLSITKKGTYQIVLSAANGCDSICYLNVTEDEICHDDHPLNPYINGCDTTYSTTYKQIREEEIPYTWNAQTVSSVPMNEGRDTTLIYTTLNATQCDSIATLHLHVLDACEPAAIYLPEKWKK